MILFDKFNFLFSSPSLAIIGQGRRDLGFNRLSSNQCEAETEYKDSSLRISSFHILFPMYVLRDFIFYFPHLLLDRISSSEEYTNIKNHTSKYMLSRYGHS